MATRKTNRRTSRMTSVWKSKVKNPEDVLLPTVEGRVEGDVRDAWTAIRGCVENELEPEVAKAELDCIEEELDELTETGWTGYWPTVEAISRFANAFGIPWVSPYAATVTDREGNSEDVVHVEALESDAAVIRSVAKIEGVAEWQLMKGVALSLADQYAPELKKDAEQKAVKTATTDKTRNTDKTGKKSTKRGK